MKGISTISSIRVGDGRLSVYGDPTVELPYMRKLVCDALEDPKMEVGGVKVEVHVDNGHVGEWVPCPTVGKLCDSVNCLVEIVLKSLKSPRSEWPANRKH